MQKLFKRIISTLTAIVVICACVLPVQAKIDGMVHLFINRIIVLLLIREGLHILELYA